MVKNTLVAAIEHHRGVAMVRMATHRVPVFADNSRFMSVGICLTGQKRQQ